MFPTHCFKLQRRYAHIHHANVFILNQSSPYFFFFFVSELKPKHYVKILYLRIEMRIQICIYEIVAKKYYAVEKCIMKNKLNCKSGFPFCVFESTIFLMVMENIRRSHIFVYIFNQSFIVLYICEIWHAVLNFFFHFFA